MHSASSKIASLLQDQADQVIFLLLIRSSCLSDAATSEWAIVSSNQVWRTVDLMSGTPSFRGEILRLKILRPKMNALCQQLSDGIPQNRRH